MNAAAVPLADPKVDRPRGVNRPVMRYHGSKWRLADWIMGFFPPHHTYVEPFGGAAGVLMQKPRSRAEVYNDLDGDVVNVFRVLRDPGQARRLKERCALTPYARAEFDLAYGVMASEDPVERARSEHEGPGCQVLGSTAGEPCMTILIAVLSFLAGASVIGALAYRAVVRMDESRQSDPLQAPPNEHVYRLVDAVMGQLYDWQQFDYRLDGRSPESDREALHYLDKWSNCNGVWIVKDGILTFPNGGSVPIRTVAQRLEQALLASYKALDEAAALVLDYADLLPAGTLEGEGRVLYSRKFAFESEIVELARLLDLNPGKNEVARFGGAELWHRQSARLFGGRVPLRDAHVDGDWRNPGEAPNCWG